MSQDIQRIVATDCGSTTTKAILIERNDKGEYRLVARGEAPTTAERAALGAGAILMDTLAVDDGRKDYQKVERLRQLRPDIILMSGGTDGGTKNHLIEMAEVVRRADPKPRFGDMKLPIIYAGNKD